MQALILIVEDEKTIADTIIYRLETDGFAVQWSSTGTEALAKIEQLSPSLIILDIGLPDINGLELCKTIRQKSTVPIIFLTARTEEIDRVVGLELGADDYLSKPFSPRELSARVRAVLRRSGSSGSVETKHTDSFMTVDESRKCVTCNGINIDLARQEFRILCALIARPKQVFSREQLMESAWDEPGFCTDRAVDAHIKSIRSKIRAVTDHDCIVTHRGFGYSFQEPSQ